jgi:hypothetical protein
MLYLASSLFRKSEFYIKSMEAMCFGRSVFEIQDGLIGIGPDTIKTGDCVVIAPGVGVPYVVRPFGSDSTQLLAMPTSLVSCTANYSTKGEHPNQHGWNSVKSFWNLSSLHATH